MRTAPNPTENGLQHADQPPSSPHHPADQSRNSPPHQLQQEQQRTNIYVRRQAVVEDLTTVFQDDNLVTSGVRVEVLGEDAVDENGVFRDVLTEFWGCVFGSAAFEGGDQAAPHPDANTTPAMWKAIGNILIVGYLQVGYLPVRFAVASLAWAMFGTVSEGTLLKSWLHSLDGVDRAMMKAVLHRGLEPDDREAVVDILDRFRITSLPSPRNIRNLCIRAAHLLFVESAAFPLLQMNIKRLRQTVPRLEDLLEIRRALKPDGQR
ncbi:uncharacterized protein LOC128555982 [Mercenaria mercenaria]|uniref:uncharacterized protein LOC128555982 n=1 Tax=Mercenaria mercenaria TaxID=6596 RepID=UPI00234FB15A|nr:uncharacterized protein LOC128555982 [Mercenaria mercenaria]